MKVIRTSFLFFILLAGLLTVSCSKSLGYSVVLWGTDENKLNNGEIVKVLIKSNISHVYVIEMPGTHENVEVPEWQLSAPNSRKNAEKQAGLLSTFINTYSSVKADGLPVRAEAINTAKQVYRLRQGEVIRVLYKGEGASVNNGKGNMEGEWFRVLTDDGTQGWCFSYNLDMYESKEGGRRAVAADAPAVEKTDDVINRIKGLNWYPAEYEALIRAKTIDLNRIKYEYGFDFGFDSGIIRIHTADLDKSWNFAGIEKTSGKLYSFTDTNVTVTVKNETLINVQFMENGKPKIETFVALENDISKLISEEKKRRAGELSKLQKFGPTFVSSNYGTLELSSSGNGEYSFTWKNFKALVPAVISSSASGSGTVKINYFLSSTLKSSYDGILSFRFSGMDRDVNFLYKKTDGGLRFEDASLATFKDCVVSGRAASPLIIFFENQ